MPQTYPVPQAFTDQARPAISMQPVDSSQIATVGYDESTKTLAVAFKRGNAIYHYPGVDRGTYDAFMSAPSKGTFFGQNIKHRAFTKYAA